MKYCTRCGSKMEDSMLFCQKCGAKSSSPANEKPELTASATQRNTQGQAYTPDWQEAAPSSRVKKSGLLGNMRTSMTIWMIVCLAEAVFVAIKRDFFIASLFIVYAVMFFVLANSPKECCYIFGKEAGLKKTPFVLIVVFGAFFTLALLRKLFNI